MEKEVITLIIKAKGCNNKLTNYSTVFRNSREDGFSAAAMRSSSVAEGQCHLFLGLPNK